LFLTRCEFENNFPCVCRQHDAKHLLAVVEVRRSPNCGLQPHAKTSRARLSAPAVS
jgi:hypothetical protein